MYKYRTGLFLFIFLCVFAGSLKTLAQKNNISFRSYSVKQGLSHKNATCVLQDKLGYMWFGTKEGLNRFDGYVFKTYKIAQGLSSDHILALMQDSAGQIWIGTFDGGLCVIDPFTEKIKIYKNDPKNPATISSNSIYSLAQDGQKNIWIGTFGGGLCRLSVDRKSFKTWTSQPGQANGLSNNSVFSIIPDQDGLWLGTNGGGLCYMNTAKQIFQTYYNEPTNPLGSLASNDVWNIFKDKTGRLWLGTYSGFSVFDPKNKTFTTFKKDTSNINSVSSNSILGVCQDKSGYYWIGTKGGGLCRFDETNKRFLRWQTEENVLGSLPSADINSVLADAEGNIWLATDGGGVAKFESSSLQFTVFANRADSFMPGAVNAICQGSGGIVWIGSFGNGLFRYDPIKDSYQNFRNDFSDSTSLSEDVITSLSLAKDGSLWIGTAENGICRLQAGSTRFEHFNMSHGLIANTIETIVQSGKQAGRIWVGTYGEGMCLYDAQKGTIVSYKNQPNQKNSLSGNVVKVILEDPEGNVWAGTQDGGLSLLTDANNGIFKTWKQSKNGLPSNSITSLARDARGNIWIATMGGGLCRLDPKTNQFVRYGVAQGMPSEDIMSVQIDKRGHIWATSSKGLVRLIPENGQIRIFTTEDGLVSNEFGVGVGFKSSSGKFYFGGAENFISFEPEKVLFSTYTAPIWLSAFRLFNNLKQFSKPLRMLDQIELSHDENFFSFEFVLLSYLDPERNSYACMMEGFDKDWIPMEAIKFKSYTNLDPGQYTFKVKASDKNKHWNENGASIRIVIYPAWYNTWWARLLAAIIVIGSGYAYYRNRIRSIEKQKEVLEQLVTERTAELVEQKKEVEIQKEKSEELLLNILPHETATELKENGFSLPRHYELVSVLFTDFKGFTKVAEKLSPQELLAELDRCFIEFDHIMDDHHLEKIKTIGDAYMCAGGIPVANLVNPIDAVLAGLRIQDFMSRLKAKKEAEGIMYWELRLGIHTGSVVAGVVGRKKFAYDIWGDTVNTASRMESSGEIGKVNISGSTYEYISPYFICHHRGRIPAKNKGEIDMYFVERLKPEYAVDADGVLPNQTLIDLLEKNRTAQYA